MEVGPERSETGSSETDKRSETEVLPEDRSVTPILRRLRGDSVESAPSPDNITVEVNNEE